VRRGVWYTVLNSLERAQVDLTIKIVERVRSPFLAKVLDRIINKLSVVWTSSIHRMVRSQGYALTFRLSMIAQSWGYQSAKTWVNDHRFAKFLAIMSLNSHRYSGTESPTV